MLHGWLRERPSHRKALSGFMLALAARRSPPLPRQRFSSRSSNECCCSTGSRSRSQQKEGGPSQVPKAIQQFAHLRSDYQLLEILSTALRTCRGAQQQKQRVLRQTCRKACRSRNPAGEVPHPGRHNILRTEDPAPARYGQPGAKFLCPEPLGRGRRDPREIASQGRRQYQDCHAGISIQYTRVGIILLSYYLISH